MDEMRGEVKVVVMKVGATFTDVLACILFNKNMCLTISSVFTSRIKSTVKFRRRLCTWHFIVSMSFICKKLGWYHSMLQINFVFNIDYIIGCVIGGGGGPYFFVDLEELQQMHTSYVGKYFVKLRSTICMGCQFI